MKELTLFDSYKAAIGAWNLSEPEEEILLGASIQEINDEWSADMLKRAVYVDSIYKDLHRLFSIDNQADSWVHRKNTQFGRRTAIKVMLTENDGLEQVARYLRGQFV